MHWGEVTVGEIGIIKKDIVFTGDVLNTTARIMDLCKQYDHTLIISEDLYMHCAPHHHFQFEALGKMTLRGKSKPISVFGVLVR
jgi:adenylate cyclase